jgi:hypothetical protein
MTPEVREFVWRATRLGPAPRRVVELGSREVAGGTVRGLFSEALSYVGLDLVDGPAVDVVADARTWRPPAGEAPPDLVLCLEVLEHTPHGRAILANAHALLPCGGRLVVTAAAPPRAPHSAADGGPLRPGEYYRNVEPAVLADWLASCGPCAPEAFEYHPQRGDVYASARKGAT